VYGCRDFLKRVQFLAAINLDVFEHSRWGEESTDLHSEFFVLSLILLGLLKIDFNV